MKCISVRQPWAELIARGTKTIELRKTRFKYRGLLVIVASAKRARGEMHPDVDGAYSRAVALVELVDVRPAAPADAARACCPPDEEDFALELRLVRRLDCDVFVKGQLSLYPPPPELAAALEVLS